MEKTEVLASHTQAEQMCCRSSYAFQTQMIRLLARDNPMTDVDRVPQVFAHVQSCLLKQLVVWSNKAFYLTTRSHNLPPSLPALIWTSFRSSILTTQPSTQTLSYILSPRSCSLLHEAFCPRRNHAGL